MAPRIPALLLAAVLAHAWTDAPQARAASSSDSGPSALAQASDLGVAGRAEAVAESLSYWGPLPSRTDSTTALFQRPPTPLWRSALYFPFRVVLFPLWLVDRGVSLLAGVALESAFTADVEEVFDLLPAPFGGRLSPTIGAGDLAGFSLGVVYWHDAFFGEPNRYRLKAVVSVRGDLLLTTGVRLGESKPTTWDLGAGWHRRLNARFFGIGPQTTADDESFYRQDYGWFGVVGRHRVSDQWQLAGELLFSSSRAETTKVEDLGKDDRDKLLQDKFDISALPGFNERSYGMSFALGLLRDTTPFRGRPGAGFYTELKLQAFQSLDGSGVAYWNARADLQRFIPLWNSKQILAVRTFGSWLDQLGSEAVPFQQLYTNGEPDGFRGFKDFRWRDHGALGATVEYRWPVWAATTVDGPGVDFYLLADVNQVFGEGRQIAWNHLQLSYGGGMRIAVTPVLLSRIEVAASHEETVFRLVAGQNFQFSIDRLFRGREPVPGR